MMLNYDYMILFLKELCKESPHWKKVVQRKVIGAVYIKLFFVVYC